MAGTRTDDPSDRRSPTSMSEADDFKGWVPNMDPHDLPVGASPDLLNVAFTRPGEFAVRRGTALLKFDPPR